MIQTSAPTVVISKPHRLRRTLALGLVIGLVAAWGSDRRPADATQPIVWRQPSILRESEPDTLRIASYNIHGGKGADRKLDLARIADDLRDVDLAGLYEVHATRGGQFADQAADLGERLGMRAAFVGTEHRWWHDHFGNAVLTTQPVEILQRIPLVGTRGKAFRQAVLLDVTLAGQPVHVLLAHVDRERDRQPQLAAVIRLFRSLQSPAILMGDLNSGPDDPQLAELLAQPGVVSALHEQLGAAAPTDNIDWLITRGLTCVEAEYRDSGASDHPVIRATLRLSAEE